MVFTTVKMAVPQITDTVNNISSNMLLVWLERNLSLGYIIISQL